MKRKIAWEKFEHQNIIESQNAEFQIENVVTIPDQEMLDIDSLQNMFKIKTPFGYYEQNDPFSPYCMFDCWIGHTNFPICSKEFNILNHNIAGIGALKVLSKYRFFIGIEKLFTFNYVRLNIQKELCGNLNSNVALEKQDSTSELFNKINDVFLSINNSNKWAIFIGKDGTVCSIKSQDYPSDDEYEHKLNSLKLLKDGNLITCDCI